MAGSEMGVMKVYNTDLSIVGKHLMRSFSTTANPNRGSSFRVAKPRVPKGASEAIEAKDTQLSARQRKEIKQIRKNFDAVVEGGQGKSRLVNL